MRFTIGDREKQLIKHLHSGERTAMKEFYSLYAGYLSAVGSRYISDDNDLKDVLQDSFLKIFTHIDDFHYQGQGSLKAWAARIVVNVAITFLRQRRHDDLLPAENMAVGEMETDDPPIDDIPPEVIHQLVRELPEGYRAVFNLYVFEQKSHREIAQILGIKQDSSASQLHRAKNLLARKIEQYRAEHADPLSPGEYTLHTITQPSTLSKQ